MHNPEELWLEPLLKRDLGATRAPDRLWDLLQRPAPPRRNASVVPLVAWAAVLLPAAVLWVFVPRYTTRPLSSEALAIEALAHEPADLELRSDTVTEIRTWVKARTGLDIALPVATSQDVQMTGVCALKGGTPAVEVAYRVGGHNAALLVSKASPTPSHSETHRFIKCESIGSTRVSSWTMRGQLYTLAYASAGDVRSECLLCHSGGEPHI